MFDQYFEKFDLAPEVTAALKKCKCIAYAETKEELEEMAYGPTHTSRYDVVYPIEGNGTVKEAEVVRCKNGCVVNFMEDYMRRRDPNSMAIGDDLPSDKPRFKDVDDELFAFIEGAQLIIHNAAFDVGFINNEFALLGQSERSDVSDYCSILDTLLMARERHPGQRNNLDALCKRYGVDNSGRDLHGALLDAEILADVYLTMTGGQTHLSLAGDGGDGSGRVLPSPIRRLDPNRAPIRVLRASEEELAAHAERLAIIEKSAGGPSLWAKMEAPAEEPAS